MKLLTSTDYEYILWLNTAAIALHMYEMYATNVFKWAKKHFKVTIDAHQYFINIAMMLTLSIALSQVGWKLPEVTLILPAFLIFKSIRFHILPALKQKAYCPGLLSAILLILPASVFSFYGAYWDNVLTMKIGAFSILGALALYLYLWTLLKNKKA